MGKNQPYLRQQFLRPEFIEGGFPLHSPLFRRLALHRPHSNVQERVELHTDGRGALWTACRRPVHLVYQEEHPTQLAAMKRER
jgi:hypothetical protein